jgi:hypothetical protein
VSPLSQLVDGQVSLIVPDFFWIEVTNLLWKAIRTAVAHDRQWHYPHCAGIS